MVLRHSATRKRAASGGRNGSASLIWTAESRGEEMRLLLHAERRDSRWGSQEEPRAKVIRFGPLVL